MSAGNWLCFWPDENTAQNTDRYRHKWVGPMCVLTNVENDSTFHDEIASPKLSGLSIYGWIEFWKITWLAKPWFMVCLRCSELAGHKQNEVLLSCYLYYYSLVFEPSVGVGRCPAKNRFVPHHAFRSLFVLWLCVPCNSLHCLNEAIFSTLLSSSSRLGSGR